MTLFFWNTFWTILYLSVPIVGWLMLFNSFKWLKFGQISVRQWLSGKTEILEKPGLYFSPAPLTRFAKTVSQTERYIDFGFTKRVCIAEGYLGVKKIISSGAYEILQPGIHWIYSNEAICDEKTDVQPIAQIDFTLGATRYVTIREGELGESYKEGIFTLLPPGRHLLSPLHRFVKCVSIQQDIVDLGACKIVTVKQNEVALVNTEQGVKALPSGKHTIEQTKNEFFICRLYTGPQGLDLAPREIMCNDQIDMEAKATLLYEITNPLKAVSVGMSAVAASTNNTNVDKKLAYLEKTLKELSEGTLRSILSRFSSADIAPSVHDHDESQPVHDTARPDDSSQAAKRYKKLQTIHNECVEALSEKVAEWGVKITSLTITQILPADISYRKTLQEIGTSKSTTAAKKQLAIVEVDIAKAKAQADESKVITAQFVQQATIKDAETEAKKVTIQAEADAKKRTIAAQAEAEAIKIKAEADAEATKMKAAADAEAIKMVAEANAARIEMLNNVTREAPEITQDLMRIEAQATVLKQVENPCFVQPTLGQTSMMTQTKSGVRFFSTTHGGETANTSASHSIVDVLALDTIRRATGKL